MDINSIFDHEEFCLASTFSGMKPKPKPKLTSALLKEGFSAFI